MEQWCNLNWKGMSFVLVIDCQDNFNFRNVSRGKERVMWYLLFLYLYFS